VHAELVGGVEEAGWSIIALAYLSINRTVQEEKTHTVHPSLQS
jgi:hypothetical protein